MKSIEEDSTYLSAFESEILSESEMLSRGDYETNAEEGSSLERTQQSQDSTYLEYEILSESGSLAIDAVYGINEDPFETRIKKEIEGLGPGDFDSLKDEMSAFAASLLGEQSHQSEELAESPEDSTQLSLD